MEYGRKCFCQLVSVIDIKCSRVIHMLFMNNCNNLKGPPPNPILFSLNHPLHKIIKCSSGYNVLFTEDWNTHIKIDFIQLTFSLLI